MFVKLNRKFLKIRDIVNLTLLQEIDTVFKKNMVNEGLKHRPCCSSVQEFRNLMTLQTQD